jgi:hypothetical protein
MQQIGEFEYTFETPKKLLKLSPIEERDKASFVKVR